MSTDTHSSLRRASAPRQIRPGTPRKSRDGDELSCLVLASANGEWVGVDLGSGALVRNRAGEDSPLFGTSRGDVASILIIDDGEPVDPARPEAIAARSAEVTARPLRRHAERRLMRQLCAPQTANSPILSARGPSIAYVDLNGWNPSIVVVGVTSRTIEVRGDAHGAAVMAVSWAGTTQLLPVLDPEVIEVTQKAAPEPLSGGMLSDTLGWKPGYVVVGLARVHEGHAKKVVLSLLRR